MSHVEELIHSYLKEVPISMSELRKQLEDLIESLHNGDVSKEQQKMLDALHQREGVLPLHGKENNLLN